MANTSCSIELEPRTLSQVQLTQAREVAAEVVQKLEPSAASALFIEGLMHPIKEETQMEENGSQVEKLIDGSKKGEAVTDEKACHCQCSCTIEKPLYIDLKEPLSAPF
ncbi:uncharacterized protein LOC133310570 [Gastrolobium bilobum]|uniref:uncharacterized protein LOC133310570 n=1 Tax=Gastrolobium bilobum TaxID=150636 RepID=UPI002AB2AB08|nr:uncharacterized protein LOC133310570 [Gastrolobium bilobum]